MIYVIGDIHGCLGPLTAALKSITRDRISSEDTVVFLGDYIDRGKQSRQVIEASLEWERFHPRTIFLRGNHEDMLLRAKKEWIENDSGITLDSDAFHLWWQNGGSETLRSYRASRKTWASSLPPSHWEFFNRTQLEYLEGGYHFVHAGLLPKNAFWEYPDEDPRLWIREPFLYSQEDFGGRIVVFGHTPQLNARPLVMPNKIGLDTAAVFGGRLTLALLDPNAEGDDRLRFEIRQF
jgi:serine/threonine protein phosphatase 1